MVFKNRQQAAMQLAKVIAGLGLENLVIFALPRGGVVLGQVISRELGVPLGVILVRKIGHPLNPEYAVGAVAEGIEPIYDTHELANLDTTWRKNAEFEAQKLMAHRRQLYNGANVTTPLTKNHSVVIVDDGIATGLTMQAAVQAARAMGASYVVVAAPVASAESVNNLSKTADRVITLKPPPNFKGSISAHYQQFEQVSDREVKQLLASSLTNLSQSVK